MNSSRARTPVVIGTLVAAIGLGAGIGAASYAVLTDDASSTVVRQVTVTDSEPAATAAGTTIGQIYERSYKAVVEITSTALDGSQRSQGSGFVYDRNGNVVTNQHVVEGPTAGGAISVRFWNGRTYAAKIVGSDPSTDLAVIKVDAPAAVFVPLRLGNSSALNVGDTVVAMGSPFGLEGTVTSGIVSALHRQMEAPNGFSITDSIQTDAAINHGNSGGPLLDTLGHVIGVNAQIESESGGNDGVGFAIPADTVRWIVTQLLQTGQARHAYLGVELRATPAGVAVTDIRPGSPAEQAELRAATGSTTVNGQVIPTGGDVIVALDGEAIATTAELQTAIDAKRPGDSVSITVIRDGERRTIDVKLGTRSS
jgi:S1-C subfamily serine protease